MILGAAVPQCLYTCIEGGIQQQQSRWRQLLLGDSKAANLNNSYAPWTVVWPHVCCNCGEGCTRDRAVICCAVGTWQLEQGITVPAQLPLP